MGWDEPPEEMPDWLHLTIIDEEDVSLAEAESIIYEEYLGAFQYTHQAIEKWLLNDEIFKGQRWLLDFIDTDALEEYLIENYGFRSYQETPKKVHCLIRGE